MALIAATLMGTACAKPVVSDAQPEKSESSAHSNASDSSKNSKNSKHSKPNVIADQNELIPLRDASGDETSIALVVFLDFQSPYSARAAKTLARLREQIRTDKKAGGQIQKNSAAGVAIEVRHAPRPMHAQSMQAAQAARAAGEFGQFWAMADWLFAHQKEMREHADDFESWVGQFAQSLGIDSDEFQDAYQRSLPVIKDDLALAEKLGVDATPYYFINGIRLAGPQSEEALARVIEDERQALAKIHEQDGALGADIYARRVKANYREPGEEPRLPSMKDQPEKPAPDAPDPRVDTSVLTVDAAQTRGPDGALVTIFFFGALDSPQTRRASADLDAALNEVGAPVRVIFKHYLASGTADDVSHRAARAAMAAGAQGKFWAMLAYILEHQSRLSKDDAGLYADAARALDLDIKRFQAALSNEEFDARALADTKQGAQLQVETPTLFIDGTRAAGVLSTDQYIDLIREALAEKQ